MSWHDSKVIDFHATWYALLCIYIHVSVLTALWIIGVVLAIWSHRPLNPLRVNTRMSISWSVMWMLPKTLQAPTLCPLCSFISACHMFQLIISCTGQLLFSSRVAQRWIWSVVQTRRMCSSFSNRNRFSRCFTDAEPWSPPSENMRPTRGPLLSPEKAIHWTDPLLRLKTVRQIQGSLFRIFLLDSRTWIPRWKFCWGYLVPTYCSGILVRCLVSCLL